METQNINGVNLAFVDRGRGPTIALLHAFPMDSRMWSDQIDHFSRTHRVIAPDLRGFGKSRCTSPFSMDSLADDVHRLLERLQALPCVLGGLSMGGYIALAYAKAHPATLRGLMLLDTKAEGDTAEAREKRNKLIDLAKSSGAKAVADQMRTQLLAPETPTVRPVIARRAQEMMEAVPEATIVNALTAMRDRPDRTADLPSIPVPTLILVGAKDAVTPPSAAETMKKAIPIAQLKVIDDAGHLSAMEQPQVVNQAIESYLHSLPPAQLRVVGPATPGDGTSM